MCYWNYCCHSYCYCCECFSHVATAARLSTEKCFFFFFGFWIASLDNETAVAIDHVVVIVVAVAAVGVGVGQCCPLKIPTEKCNVNVQ